MKQTSPGTDSALAQLQQLVNDLTKKPTLWVRPGVHPKLILLLSAWQRAGEESRKALRVWKASGYADDKMPVLFPLRVPDGCPTFAEMQARCKVMLNPNMAGKSWHANVIYLGEQGKKWTKWDFACQKFIFFVLNPHCDRFGGPCPALHCGKFFIRTTAKEKRYCSRTCAQNSSARASTQRRRVLEHNEKIASVRRAIEDWSQKPRKMDWRRWIASRHPEITKTWITRAVNSKEIVTPISKPAD